MDIEEQEASAEVLSEENFQLVLPSGNSFTFILSFTFISNFGENSYCLNLWL